jgi:hypothetical protein
MHVYQMRSSVRSVVEASQERIQICMAALKEVSKVWLVARMVHTLFESILGNNSLAEKLQKASGRKAPRNKNGPVQPNGHNSTTHNPNLAPAPPPPPASNVKRKFDEFDIGYSGPPAPQMSYERSRPQTPAVTPSRELSQPQANNALGSPPLPNDPLMPNTNRGTSRLHSRGPTRANSPFNGYSIPATPPDLFLVTRDEPNISQQMWDDFQPHQLFPDGTIGDSNMFNSPTMQHAVDPQLQVPNTGMGGHMSDVNMQGWGSNMGNMMGTGVDGGGRHAEDDRWSNSSMGNVPVAPLHLDLEGMLDCSLIARNFANIAIDWYSFFGIAQGQPVG